MQVIDYTRRVDPGSFVVTVPPFHTGHLGLVPGTDVSIVASRIQQRYEGGPIYGELIISPVAAPGLERTRVTASLHEQPGIVLQLVTSISSLGINVEIEESSPIDGFAGHTVTLFLDLSRLEVGDRRVPSAASLHRFASLLPIEDRKARMVFLAILAGCGEELRQDGDGLPMLRIFPLESPKQRWDVSHVRRGRGGHFNVEIEVPAGAAALLENARRHHGSGGHWHYIFTSDTRERVLRVSFLVEDVAERLIHASFDHDNRPGALETILKLVRDGGFNIVVSLLRPKTDSQNTWEAVLDPGPGAMGASGIDRWKDPAGWFDGVALPLLGSRLDRVAEGVSDFGEFTIEVGPPRYPKRYGPWTRETDDDSIERFRRIVATPGRGTPTAGIDPWPRVLSSLRDLPARLMPVSEAAELREEYVFLSYPESARDLGKALLALLQQAGMEGVDLQEAGPDVIRTQVSDLVSSCTVFLGIWVTDDLVEDGSGGNLSPWMPYELGLAHALSKPCALACQTGIETYGPRRIVPERGIFEFDKGHFHDRACQGLIDFARKSIDAVRVPKPPPWTAD